MLERLEWFMSEYIKLKKRETSNSGEKKKSIQKSNSWTKKARCSNTISKGTLAFW